MADSGANFSFNQLDKMVIKKDGTKHVVVEEFLDHIKGKDVMLYFSAHWCPPCRSFTPQLVEFYEKYRDAKNFEIIFISLDKDDKSFTDYYKDMPWLAVKFSKEDPTAKELRESIAKQFSVTGIPCLVVLGEDGKVKIDNARSHVTSKRDAYPWKEDWKN